MFTMALRNCHSFFIILVLIIVVVLVVFNTSRSKRCNLGGHLKDKPWSATPSYMQSSNVSYMLALHYAEQLIMSTAHYIQFLNLVADWNFTGVEPFICKSRMFGFRQPSKVNVKFGLLLNMSTLSSELSTCLNGGSHPSDKEKRVLVQSMDEFLKHSYRSISIVYFIKHMCIFSKEIHDGIDYGVKFDKEPVVDCTSIARREGLSKAVEIKLNQDLYTSMDEDLYMDKSITELEFYVEQAFCVHNTKNVTLVQIMEYIHQNVKHQESSTSNRLASVVFVSWQGQYTRKFSDRLIMDRCRLSPAKIAHSNTVLKTAKTFIESLGLGKNSYLSVHIRFEKLFEPRKNNPELFYQCAIKKLNGLIGKMRQRCNLSSDSAALLTKDYGPYGSDTCHYEYSWKPLSVCVNKAKKLLSELVIKSAEFEPVVFGLPSSSGLVSLVEADSLLCGRALIVVGGGSYQHSIMERFRSTHGNECTASLNERNILEYTSNGTAICITV